MWPLILVQKPKWANNHVKQSVSCFQDNQLGWFRLLCHPVWPHPSQIIQIDKPYSTVTYLHTWWVNTQGLGTSTMAARVCVTSPESPLQMRRVTLCISVESSLFSFRARTVKQTQFDWSVIRLHRQSWKLTGGTVGIRDGQSGIKQYFKQCVMFSNSRCHGHSWPARYDPSHWILPRRLHRAVHLSSWCNAHRAP